MVLYSFMAVVATFTAILAQSLQVNTPPSVVGCEPSQIQWSGGSPPYFLSFVPAGEPGATPLKQFPSQNGNAITWNTDLPTGTLFTISLRDGTGAVAFSDKVTVQPGPDSSCLSNGAASGGNTSDTTSTGGSTGSGTANPGNPGGGGNSTGGTPSPPAPAHSSGGMAPAVQLSPIPHPASGSVTATPSKGKSNEASNLNGVNGWLTVVGLASLAGVHLL